MTERTTPLSQSPTLRTAIRLHNLLACPKCHGELVADGDDTLICLRDGFQFEREDGIWRFLPRPMARRAAEHIAAFETLLAHVDTPPPTPAQLRALPTVSRNHPEAARWRRRERSLRTLTRHVLADMPPSPVTLDLGAGTGWLAHQLAGEGHDVVAIDLMLDQRHGLGAWTAFGPTYLPVWASFDYIPLARHCADLAIFNGSLHYSADIIGSLRAALRHLKPDGRLVIMETPLFHRGRTGQLMMAERAAHFRHTYGLDMPPHEGYLTHDRLVWMAARLNLQWRVWQPPAGWWARMRPWVARLRGLPAPPTLPVIVGRRARR